MIMQFRSFVRPWLFFVCLVVMGSANAHQCRDSQGLSVDIGELACLTINGTSYMARCEKSGEDMLWRRITDEGCPVS